MMQLLIYFIALSLGFNNFSQRQTVLRTSVNMFLHNIFASNFTRHVCLKNLCEWVLVSRFIPSFSSRKKPRFLLKFELLHWLRVKKIFYHDKKCGVEIITYCFYPTLSINLYIVSFFPFFSLKNFEVFQRNWILNSNKHVSTRLM